MTGSSVKPGVEAKNVKTGIADASDLKAKNITAGFAENNNIVRDSFVPEHTKSVITHYANISRDIGRFVSDIKTGGNYELKMKLLPEGLGEVLVKVTLNGKSELGVHITAATAAAQKELELQSEQLRTSIEAHNMNLLSLDINQKNQQQQQREFTRENQNARYGTAPGSDSEADTQTADEKIPGIRNANAYNRLVYINA